MNALTRRGDGLPAPFREPTLTPEVAGAVAQYLSPDPHAGPRVRPLAAHLRQRAADFVATADAESGPAPLAVVKRWLLIVSTGPANPPAPDEFGAKAAAIATACSDLPGWGFNEASARTALQRFKFFPTAAEVYELIAEATKPQRDTLRALRALAEAPARPEPDDPPMTAEVRCELAAKLRAAREEMDARAAVAERANPSGRPIKAKHLPPDVLARVREASPAVRAARAAAGQV